MVGWLLFIQRGWWDGRRLINERWAMLKGKKSKTCTFLKFSTICTLIIIPLHTPPWPYYGKGQFVGPTQDPTNYRTRGMERAILNGPDIMFGVNFSPLAPFSVAHKFNDFIVKKKNLTLHPKVWYIRIGKTSTNPV